MNSFIWLSISSHSLLFKCTLELLNSKAMRLPEILAFQLSQYFDGQKYSKSFPYFWRSKISRKSKPIPKLLKLSTYVENLKVFKFFDIFPKIPVYLGPKFSKMSKIILKHLKKRQFLSKISLKNGQKLQQKFRTFQLSTWTKTDTENVPEFWTFFSQKAV